MVREPEDTRGGSAVVPETTSAGDPALTDVETRLPNRLHFDVVYRVVFAAGTRGFPLTLVLIETGGLLAAEGALVELAERMTAVTRRMDLLARFDDTRYAVLLLGCNVHGGRIAAERFVDALAPIVNESGGTIHAGAAALTGEMTDEAELVGMAETALAAAREGSSGSVETLP